MDYMTLFPAFMREKPRFAALAQAILSQVTDLMTVIQAIPAAFSPGYAEGIQLDAVGKAAGLPRPEGMSDADYRKYLLAWLMLCSWDGTNETAQAVLSAAFPGSTISDNLNGTVTVHTVDSLQADYRLYPLPAGVQAVVT